jgi:hypothetical protein
VETLDTYAGLWPDDNDILLRAVDAAFAQVADAGRTAQSV